MKTCNLCQKDIEEDPYIYIGMWKDYRTNSVIHYHVECFKQLAGEQYVNELLSAKMTDVDEVY